MNAAFGFTATVLSALVLAAATVLSALVLAAVATPLRRINSCALPIQPGPCRARLQRYAFDSAVGQCLPFTYGGCRGNANNFATLDKCTARCPNQCPPGVPEVRCFQAPCAASACPAFPNAKCFDNYCGGCNAIYVLANGTRLTPQQCSIRVPPPPPPRDRACSLPIQPGSCRAAIPRYAFNTSEGICHPFTYGGCDGNANNFETMSACLNTCPTQCPPGVESSICIALFCFGKTCPAHPEATCVHNYCGGCTATFYLPSGQRLSDAECAAPASA